MFETTNQYIWGFPTMGVSQQLYRWFIIKQTPLKTDDGVPPFYTTYKNGEFGGGLCLFYQHYSHEIPIHSH